MKKINLIFLSLLFGCVLFTVSCADQDKDTNGGGIADYGPGYDPNDPIDAKYPYWRVTIKGFGCSNGTKCTWTAAEKKSAIEMMAKLRAMLNIPEFQDVFRQKAPYIVDKNASYEGSPYSVTMGSTYDTERLLWSILNADFEVTYRKQDSLSGGIASAIYVQLGYNPDVYNFDYVCNFPNSTFNGTATGYVAFTSLVFHEHLHNMGMTHENTSNERPDEVSRIQLVLNDWWRDGNYKEPKLETSHQAQIDEITKYYLKKYAHLFASDTSN